MHCLGSTVEVVEGEGGEPAQAEGQASTSQHGQDGEVDLYKKYWNIL